MDEAIAMTNLYYSLHCLERKLVQLIPENNPRLLEGANKVLKANSMSF